VSAVLPDMTNKDAYSSIIYTVRREVAWMDSINAEFENSRIFIASRGRLVNLSRSSHVAGVCRHFSPIDER